MVMVRILFGDIIIIIIIIIYLLKDDTIK